MEFWVLDTDFKAVGVVETYESAIWTDRFFEHGDFEIFTGMSQDLLNLLAMDRYLLLPGQSDHAMIVESHTITEDADSGVGLKITGRSLESILDRRIVWNQQIYKGNLQDAVQSMLNDAIISPTDPDRKIENFVFQASEDEAITKLTIDAQYTGDDLYTVISGLCKKNKIGFKITLDEDFKFIFQLYAGTDRSYAQTKNPYVVFSSGFDNILEANYYHDRTDYKNVTLVAGEGEGSARKTLQVGEGTGINRRELFTDARDISSTTDGGTLTNAQYMEQLKTRGTENLSDYAADGKLEGKMDASEMFIYGRDFFMGDTVQLADGYGHEGSSMVTEMIMSYDTDGISAYPTFSNLDDLKE